MISLATGREIQFLHHQVKFNSDENKNWGVRPKIRGQSADSYNYVSIYLSFARREHIVNARSATKWPHTRQIENFCNERKRRTKIMRRSIRHRRHIPGLGAALLRLVRVFVVGVLLARLGPLARVLALVTPSARRF